MPVDTAILRGFTRVWVECDMCSGRGWFSRGENQFPDPCVPCLGTGKFHVRHLARIMGLSLETLVRFVRYPKRCHPDTLQKIIDQSNRLVRVMEEGDAGTIKTAFRCTWASHSLRQTSRQSKKAS